MYVRAAINGQTDDAPVPATATLLLQGQYWRPVGEPLGRVGGIIWECHAIDSHAVLCAYLARSSLACQAQVSWLHCKLA